MRVVIKVENNLKEILEFLEEKGYKWSSGDLPTEGINWGSKLILINGKTLMYRSISSYYPDAITLEQFKNKIDMKTSNILPGHKLVLENGNVFVVMEYKGTKIAFPEGSSRTITDLDDLCEEDLSPKMNVSRIMKVLNDLNIPVWERKFTRNEISAGYTLVNKYGIEHLVVIYNRALRLLNTKNFVLGLQLSEVVNKDMTSAIEEYAEVIEVRNTEGKVVYKKK